MPSSPIESLVRRFLDRTLPKAEWTHEAHLRVALWHLLRYSPAESLDRLRDAISNYNVSAGNQNTEADGYHETITRVHVAVIADFVATRDIHQPFEDLTATLLEEHGAKDLPLRYYTKERLMSKEARLGWVEPDLAPLPATATAI